MAWPASARAAVLRDYFRAKDGNRPHLLDQVFTRGRDAVQRNIAVPGGAARHRDRGDGRAAADAATPVLDWLTRLPYPWWPPDSVRVHAPALVELAPVLAALDGLAA